MAEATKNIVVNNISLQKSAAEHSKKVLGLENLREYQLEDCCKVEILLYRSQLDQANLLYLSYYHLPLTFTISYVGPSQEKSEKTKGKLIDEVVNSKKLNRLWL